jgi:hypothetical protein
MDKAFCVDMCMYVLLRNTKSSFEVQRPQCGGLGLGVGRRCRKNRQKVRGEGDVGIRVLCQVN